MLSYCCLSVCLRMRSSRRFTGTVAAINVAAINVAAINIAAIDLAAINVAAINVPAIIIPAINAADSTRSRIGEVKVSAAWTPNLLERQLLIPR